MCKPTSPIPQQQRANANRSSTGSARSSTTSNRSSTKSSLRKKHRVSSSLLKKRVDFSDTYIVDHYVGPNPEQQDDCWYKAEELQALQADVTAMIKAYRSSETPKSEKKKMYWRGLENYKDKHPRKKLRRTHSRQVVYFHKMLYTDDPLGLRLFAADQSLECATRARELAEQDEEEAMMVYLDEAVVGMQKKLDDSVSETSTTEEDDDSCHSASPLDETAHASGWVRGPIIELSPMVPTKKKTKKQALAPEMMELAPVVPLKMSPKKKTKKTKGESSSPKHSPKVSSPKKKSKFLRAKSLTALVPFL